MANDNQIGAAFNRLRDVYRKAAGSRGRVVTWNRLKAELEKVSGPRKKSISEAAILYYKDAESSIEAQRDAEAGTKGIRLEVLLKQTSEFDEFGRSLYDKYDEETPENKYLGDQRLTVREMALAMPKEKAVVRLGNRYDAGEKFVFWK